MAILEIAELVVLVEKFLRVAADLRPVSGPDQRFDLLPVLSVQSQACGGHDY